jgi:RNA polymerase sigma-70 factor (ECF subfamily)
VAVERVEPPFPHAKRLDPLPSFVEAFWAERALPDPAHLLRREQLRLLEDAHVFQDRRKGDPEGSCQLADRRRARGDELQDAAAGQLNRAIAIAETEGPEAGLHIVEGLGLDDFRYLHSTKAELLRRLGRTDEAGDAYRRSIELTDDGAERRFIERRLTELAATRASGESTTRPPGSA